MVCPNCQSTDIIKIQNQSYCINCGQLVAETKPKSKPAAVKAIVPKAAIPKATAAKIIKHSASLGKSPLQPKTSQPERPAARPGRTVSDLSVARPRQVAKPAPKPKVSKPPAPVSKPQPVVTRSKPLDLRPETKPANSTKHPQFYQPTLSKPSQLAKAALAQTRVNRFWMVSLIGVMLLIPLIGALISGLVVWQTTLGAPGLSSWLAWHDLIAYIANHADIAFSWLLASSVTTVAYLSLAGLLLTWSVNAISFGAGKIIDGRPTKSGQWSRAAWNSLPGCLWLILITTGLKTMVGLGGFFGLRLVSLIPSRLSYLATGGALLVVVVSILLGLGLIYAAILGRYAIVLGGLSGWKAFSFGFKNYARHFGSLITYGLMACLINLALVVLPAGLTVAVITLLRQQTIILPAGWFLVGSTILLTPVAIGLLVFNTCFWLLVYRRQVISFGPDIAKLLAGRQPKRVSRLAVAGGSIIYIGIVGAMVGFALSSHDQAIDWLKHLT